MSKHTPGPWRSKQEYANSWRIEQDVSVEKIGFSIALVTTTVLEMGSDNGSTPANARLIAAAPDLLAALQTIQDRILMDGTREEFDLICAAIKKATGESA